MLAALDATRAADVVRVEVDGPALAAALRQVRPAADGEAGSALASVLVDVRGARVDVVATNRFWLACRTVEGRAVVVGEGRALLPLPAAAVLADRLETTDDVSLVVDDGRLSVDADDGLVAVDTSAQPFPAHRLVLAGLPGTATTVLLTGPRCWPHSPAPAGPWSTCVRATTAWRWPGSRSRRSAGASRSTCASAVPCCCGPSRRAWDRGCGCGWPTRAARRRSTRPASPGSPHCSCRPSSRSEGRVPDLVGRRRRLDAG